MELLLSQVMPIPSHALATMARCFWVVRNWRRQKEQRDTVP
jgi:hypothetical protein